MVLRHRISTWCSRRSGTGARQKAGNGSPRSYRRSWRADARADSRSISCSPVWRVKVAGKWPIEIRSIEAARSLAERVLPAVLRAYVRVAEPQLVVELAAVLRVPALEPQQRGHHRGVLAEHAHLLRPGHLDLFLVGAHGIAGGVD